MIPFFDLHVHASPGLFPRNMSANELASSYNDSQCEGFLLKFHHGSSVELANQLDAKFPRIRVFGGLCLNRFVGAINPIGVESSIKLGAKMIWLPTIHSAAHEKACGCLGAFEFQGSPCELNPSPGLKIIDQNEKLTRQTQEILDLLHGSSTILGTGHISNQEIRILIHTIKERSLQIKLLINHVFFSVPHCSLEDLKSYQGENIYFECSELSTNPGIGAIHIQTLAKNLKDFPDFPWILVSDGGQKQNPPPIEVMTGFYENLLALKVEESRLYDYFFTNPRNCLQ